MDFGAVFGYLFKAIPPVTHLGKKKKIKKPHPSTVCIRWCAYSYCSLSDLWMARQKESLVLYILRG